MQQPQGGGPARADGGQPATRDDLRGLRRWLIVAGIWAVAATALGIVAYLEARDAREAQSAADSATQADVDRARNQLRGEIEELSAKVDDLPTQGQLSRVQNNVRRAQRAANAAAGDASQASDGVDRLRTRFEDLQREVNALASQTTSGTDGNGD